MESSEQPSQISTGESLQYAGFGRRLLAYILDGLLLSALPFSFFILKGYSASQGFSPTLTLASLVVSFIYFVLLWVNYNGQTIGKRIFGIKIIAIDNQPLGYTKAILRWIGYYLSMVPFFLGFLWIIWDKEKRGWHDKIAGTKVIVIDPRPKTIQAIITIIIIVVFYTAFFGLSVFSFIQSEERKQILKSFEEPTLPESRVNRERSNIIVNQRSSAYISTECGITIPVPQTVDTVNNRKWVIENIISSNIEFDIINPLDIPVVNPRKTAVVFKDNTRATKAVGVEIRCIDNIKGLTLQDYERTVLTSGKPIEKMDSLALGPFNAVQLSIKTGAKEKTGYILISADNSKLIYIKINRAPAEDIFASKLEQDISFIISNIK